MMRRFTFVLVLFFVIVVFPISANTGWESYTNLYMYTIPGPSFYADLSNSAHVFDGSHGGNYSENPSNNAYSNIDNVVTTILNGINEDRLKISKHNRIYLMVVIRNILMELFDNVYKHAYTLPEEKNIAPII